MNERMDRVEAALERLTERQEALAKAMELHSRMTDDRLNSILQALEQDAENIRALARIAEIHERRLSDLEGPGQ